VQLTELQCEACGIRVMRVAVDIRDALVQALQQRQKVILAYSERARMESSCTPRPHVDSRG
jgi:hypothetical protein